MDINELFRRKGELHTKLEILQQQLVAVNKQITEEINKPKPAEIKSEALSTPN